MKCSNHSSLDAKWQCEGCLGTFCDSCVKMLGGRAATAAVCPACGQKCENLAQAEFDRTYREPSFWERLPHILTYPLHKDGPFILVAGAVFFAIAEFMASLTFLIGIIFSALITGYLFRYYFSIMYRTARGAPDPPTWPDFDPANLFEESFLAIVKFVAPGLVSFAPAILYIYFGPRAVDAIFLALMAGGCLYYPMGLAVAVVDDRAGLNPVPVVRAIACAPFDYFGAAIIFMLLFYANYLRELYLPIRIFAVGSVVRWLIVLYFWTMVMHLLGLFSHTHRHKLRWASLA